MLYRCFAPISCLVWVVAYLNYQTIKLFVRNTPFLYPLKTSENRKVFWYFQEIEKVCVKNKWVNQRRISDPVKHLWWSFLWKYRNSSPDVFYKISVLEKYAKFRWKHLCQRLFFNSFLIELQTDPEKYFKTILKQFKTF